MQAEVAIIIPVYNAADFLSETLASVRAQTFTAWECILVDDHSTDDSITVIEKFVRLDDRFIFFQNPLENKGAAGARNTALEKARGRFIAFLDADDLWHPEKLQVQVDFFKANPTVAITYSHYELFDHKTKKNTKQIKAPVCYKTPYQLMKNTCIGMSFAMVNKKITGNFTIHTVKNIREDAALWIDLLSKGFIAKRCGDAILGMYRLYEEQSSANKIKMVYHTLRTYLLAKKINKIRAIFCWLCNILNGVKKYSSR